MTIKTTVVCLPVRDLGKTLEFYRNVLGFSDAQIEEGMMVLELPNLSLFLMGQDAFEAYSTKTERRAQFPDAGNTCMIISCAMESRDGVDAVLENATRHGGSAPGKAAMDETSGGYTGYLADPDGHLWELVCPQQQQCA